MAAPEYAQGITLAIRNSSRTQQAAATTGMLRKPSVTGSAWALLDVLTTLVACLIAIRFRLDVSEASGVVEKTGVLLSLWGPFGFYRGWFARCLGFAPRSAIV